jgi:hypothetical protein
MNKLDYIFYSQGATSFSISLMTLPGNKLSTIFLRFGKLLPGYKRCTTMAKLTYWELQKKEF